MDKKTLFSLLLFLFLPATAGAGTVMVVAAVFSPGREAINTAINSGGMCALVGALWHQLKQSREDNQRQLKAFQTQVDAMSCQFLLSIQAEQRLKEDYLLRVIQDFQKCRDAHVELSRLIQLNGVRHD
jgi:hypothetical protein